ncbi:MAG TPA: prolyl oligopeptidase family serine peptidase [Flavisolibacter sp.]|jgi:predicted peptidase|nr:prolyl oligopeptidase family serine peptidase [Flavisolibacter sp.]
MTRTLLALCLVFFLASTASSQDRNQYEKRLLVSSGDTLPYRILLPQDFNPKKKYPLILFLHGSGERGRDNEAQLTHGWKLFLGDSIRNAFPAIVVFPQCPSNSSWSNVQFAYDSASKKRTFNFLESGDPTTGMRLVLELLDKLGKDYKLDKGRLYVGGLSMGGMGTFELVARKPKMFAAAFPICGGANPTAIEKFSRPAWWVFHGAKDDVVPPQYSQVMVDALKAIGANVKFTLYPNASHNSWDAAFAEKDLMPWLFSQKK